MPVHWPAIQSIRGPRVSDNIFREVDEELRKDKLQDLWKRYGTLVIAGCVALVLGTAGSVLWRNHQADQRSAESARFAAAIELVQRGDNANAVTAFSALADDAGSGYALIARFQEAAARAETGDSQGAVAVYDGIVADGGADQIYRDLAALMAAMQLANVASAADLEARLQALLTDDNPWRFSAQELIATVAVREGRTAAAVESFKALTEAADAPPGVRARAQQMLNALGEGG